MTPLSSLSIKCCCCCCCCCLACLLLSSAADGAPGHDKATTSQHSQFVANDYVTKMFNGKGELDDLNDYLVDYAHLIGLVYIDKNHQLNLKKEQNFSNHFAVTEPMTMFPSPFPEELFKQSMDMQKLMSEVHLRVSLNHEFLAEAMKDVAKADPFIREMMKIMDKVKKARRQSGMTLILQRADYMTHQETLANGETEIQLKQVEAASGIGKGQGDNPSLAHQRLLDKIRYTREGDGLDIPEWFKTLKVPVNESDLKQAEALYETWLQFRLMHDAPEAVILLISAPKRRFYSHFEQLRWAQFRLEDVARKRKQGGCPQVVQITIKECTKRLKLGDDHHMRLDGKRRVAVAIWLDGYLPAHFTKRDWKMRTQMEQSQAVMSPNVFVFLAGTKKVQQVLAEPEELERFFPEAKTDEMLQKQLAKLRRTFIPQWALGKAGQSVGKAGKTKKKKAKKVENALIAQAIARPGDYVLKENMQSGKGTYFGADLVTKLKDLLVNVGKRAAFILQKKVRPFTAKNAIVPIPTENGIKELEIVDVDSEVSIFGSLLAVKSEPKNDKDNEEKHGENQRKEKRIVLGHEIVHNEADGYELRTKVSTNNMCNVSSGNGGLDSIVLFPMKDFVTTKSADSTDTTECLPHIAADTMENLTIQEEEEPPADAA